MILFKCCIYNSIIIYINNEMEIMTGTIKWFNPSKGYGFITKPDGSDVFLHFTGLAEGQDRRLYPGDEVSFDEGVGERGSKAENVVCTKKVERSNHAEVNDS